MPGGSPNFRSASDIERLYEELQILFENLSTWCRSVTLKEFDARFRESPAQATSSGPGDGRTATTSARSAPAQGHWDAAWPG